MGKIRKYLLGIAMAMCLVAGNAGATLLSACPTTGTYADLVSLGGCSIDDKNFADFFFQSADTTASSVSYSVVNLPGLDGFTFQFGLTNTTAGTSLDFAIGYDVQCATTNNCITSAHGDITASGVNGGSAGVVEHLCLNDLRTSCQFGGPTETLFQPGGPTTFDLAFAPGLTTLGVTKDVDATCAADSVNCRATISVLTNEVDQHAPEPATLLLLGAGLAGLGLSRRRKA